MHPGAAPGPTVSAFPCDSLYVPLAQATKAVGYAGSTVPMAYCLPGSVVLVEGGYGGVPGLEQGLH